MLELIIKTIETFVTNHSNSILGSSYASTSGMVAFLVYLYTRSTVSHHLLLIPHRGLLASIFATIFFTTVTVSYQLWTESFGPVFDVFRLGLNLLLQSYIGTYIYKLLQIRRRHKERKNTDNAAR